MCVPLATLDFEWIHFSSSCSQHYFGCDCIELEISGIQSSVHLYAMNAATIQHWLQEQQLP